MMDSYVWKVLPINDHVSENGEIPFTELKIAFN
jgi:hypothetical protein